MLLIFFLFISWNYTPSSGCSTLNAVNPNQKVKSSTCWCKVSLFNQCGIRLPCWSHKWLLHCFKVYQLSKWQHFSIISPFSRDSILLESWQVNHIFCISSSRFWKPITKICETYQNITIVVYFSIYFEIFRKFSLCIEIWHEIFYIFITEAPLWQDKNASIHK